MAEAGTDPVDTICDLLLARGSRREPGHVRAVDQDPAQFVKHPVGMVGTDSTFHRREAKPTDLWFLPADPRPIRAR
jgi:hypothetical protein